MLMLINKLNLLLLLFWYLKWVIFRVDAIHLAISELINRLLLLIILKLVAERWVVEWFFCFLLAYFLCEKACYFTTQSTTHSGFDNLHEFRRQTRFCLLYALRGSFVKTFNIYNDIIELLQSLKYHPIMKFNIFSDQNVKDISIYQILPAAVLFSLIEIQFKFFFHSIRFGFIYNKESVDESIWFFKLFKEKLRCVFHSFLWRVWHRNRTNLFVDYLLRFVRYSLKERFPDKLPLIQ